MEKINFNEWLIEKKQLQNNSARDVISRYVRATNFLGREPVSLEDIDYLMENGTFIECSKTVKSQMRRAIRLYIEFMEENKSGKKR